MIDLIYKKENKDDSFVYLAEIGQASQARLLQALMRYKLADEWIVYLLPLVQGSGIRIADTLTSVQLERIGFQTYKNSICRIEYRL